MSSYSGRAPVLIVVLIGLLWGLNWPAVKFMLTEIPPLTVRALAFTFAAILLAGIAAARAQSLRPAVGELRPIFVTGILIIFGFNVLTAIGQTLTETSKAAIIAFTMPALTAGLAAALLGERLETRHVIALILGMTGLGILASEDFAALVREPTGPVVMFFAALSWALGNVALKSRTWSLPSLPLTVWFFIASSIACWPLVLIFEPPWQQDWPSDPVLLTLVYHVTGPMVVCYALWTGMVERLPATVAAIATLLTPVVGVASAIILLGDAMTWQKVVSLSLIVVSISMTVSYRRKPESE